MKENKTYPMTPFDLETTDDSLRMMKLFLPYLPPSYQKMLGIYIKFHELQHTLTVLSFPIKAMHTQSLPPAPPLFFLHFGRNSALFARADSCRPGTGCTDDADAGLDWTYPV